MTSGEPLDGKGTAQTLSRGIRILEHLADRGAAATIPELVAALSLHRSIVYRLLRTHDGRAAQLRRGAGDP